MVCRFAPQSRCATSRVPLSRMRLSIGCRYYNARLLTGSVRITFITVHVRTRVPARTRRQGDPSRMAAASRTGGVLFLRNTPGWALSPNATSSLGAESRHPQF